MQPQKGSLEIIAGLIIVVGVITATVLWTAFLRDTPNLDIVTDQIGSTTGKNGSSTIDGTEGILPYNSGISGIVMSGPTCPIEYNADEGNCSDKPYATLVAIYRASDPVHAIVLTKSDAEGTFEASLPPGDYIVGVGESNLPRCEAVNVAILPDVYASIEVLCDTGIR